MIEATTEVWTTYTKAHPGASQLRYKPIRNYDKLFILLGKDRATGSLAADASVSAPKSNKETKKRKAKYADIVSEELRSIRVGMDAVVVALDRSNLQNYTEKQLFEEIAKIGGMSDVSHMKAYQALTGDSTGDQWWFASPIDWAAVNGHYDLVRELLRIDNNHLIKLTSLPRVRLLETMWDDEEQFHDVARCRSQVAQKLLVVAQCY
ncbi:hypothetical protein CK203_035034 [Vitis vinifera]|uniref:Uncharacterized protein n=1 Tax=Vitis vinifera TaxID=29760 RepID=A0A438I9T2_VITVI|nr:hypothetical protein CK203_035034 [Vitis vinifera]